MACFRARSGFHGDPRDGGGGGGGGGGSGGAFISPTVVVTIDVHELIECNLFSSKSLDRRKIGAHSFSFPPFATRNERARKRAKSSFTRERRALAVTHRRPPFAAAAAACLMVVVVVSVGMSVDKIWAPCNLVFTSRRAKTPIRRRL